MTLKEKFPPNTEVLLTNEGKEYVFSVLTSDVDIKVYVCYRRYEQSSTYIPCNVYNKEGDLLYGSLLLKDSEIKPKTTPEKEIEWE